VSVVITSLLGCSGEDFASILTSLGYRLRKTPKVVKPVDPVAAPAEASAEAPALEQTLSDNPSEVEPSAVAEVEAVPADVVVVEADIPATTIIEAAPVEAVAAEPAPVDTKPAEPEFDEVWFPGGKRTQDNAKRHGGPRRGPTRPEGEVQDVSKAQHLNGKARFENRAKAEVRPKFDKPRGDAPKQDNNRPVRDERKVVYDPDSPFAALAALRNKKPE
jgi:ATP-dependent RNA helicase SUPV3L1/SUV3